MHRSILRGALVAAALLVAPVPAALAQAADPAAVAAQQKAMARLAWMRGLWRGPAQSTGPGGEAKLIQTERIGSALDGTILVIEGKGYMPDGKPGFHAFAVVSYEVATGSYWLTSNAQGRSGRFRLTPTDTGYAWEIPQGPGVVRYVATLADGTWTETGDFAMPGQPARRFFQMTLKRIGDTDWPEAGGVPPR